jgi:hypothetical protein
MRNNRNQPAGERFIGAPTQIPNPTGVTAMRRAILVALAMIVTLGFTAQGSTKDATDLRGTTWITAS